MKKARLFVCSPGTDDVDCYCGEVLNLPKAMEGVRYLLESEIENLTEEEPFEVVFSVKMMTDEEVDNLPCI